MEGKLTKPGMGNPMSDVYDIEEELVRWFSKVIDKTITKLVEHPKKGVPFEQSLSHDLAGLKITQEHTKRALELNGLSE